MRKRRNIVVLGFSMVGKTAICVRYCTDRFNERYEPTYESSFRKTLNHRGQDLELVITDTQGQDEQEIFRKEYCLGAHGYILVYSVTSKRSLESCIQLDKKLVNLMGTNDIPRILVGNKTDLGKGRVITAEEGASVAAKLGCKFMECSAKSNTGVDRVFNALLKEIDRFKDEEPKEVSGWGILSFFSRCQTNSAEWPKLRILLSALILLTLLLGLGGIALGLVIGIKASATSDGDLLAYIFFGFGLFTALISALGLAGVWNQNREFIRVYSGTLSVILVVEIMVGVFLFSGLSLIKSHMMDGVLLLTIPVVVQLVSVVFSCWVQTALEEGAEVIYEPITSPTYNI